MKALHINRKFTMRVFIPNKIFYQDVTKIYKHSYQVCLIEPKKKETFVLSRVIFVKKDFVYFFQHAFSAYLHTLFVMVNKSRGLL